MTPAVAAPPTWADPLLATAGDCGTDVEQALAIALEVGHRLPLPGSGQTASRWAVLAALARSNVTVARVTEAHVDALAILVEAGEAADADRTWGVFAAERGDVRLVAERRNGNNTLSGTKPWCSLGDTLDAALVTAHVDDGARQLFRVDLRNSGVTAHPRRGWVSRGLPTVVSVGLDFDDVPAHPVGEPDWYLHRPGFAWGGIGVAACWYGAARGVADLLRSKNPDDIGAMHCGRVDAALHACECVLDAAAAVVDARRADGEAGTLLALRVRSIVARAAEDVVRDVSHATGPAPLALDERHAARVADLQIYLRQHHGEHDLAELGRLAAEVDQ